ncbi:restriction endonuclease [Streptomyces sp. SID6673]|nr:restriction endonuclease [Streptomyces sp. SID11726]NDZ94939.1 restriction endonuclease [Streptomyces sp. SID11726]NEB23098.1 restriction endonuclease [Streptomyces sp. SID6673]
MQYISTPHQAELNAQDQMRSWGFIDAVATTGGADGGLDVRSSRALAQVKWKGGVTGRPDVQNLYGARGAGTEQLFFFSASGYSDQAITYADQVGILLVTYDPLGAVEGVNQAARRFLADMAESPATVQTPTDWKLVSLLTAVLIVVLSVTILLWWP